MSSEDDILTALSVVRTEILKLRVDLSAANGEENNDDAIQGITDKLAAASTAEDITKKSLMDCLNKSQPAAIVPEAIVPNPNEA